MKILLIMRTTYAWHAVHIETLLNMGLELHLATRVAGAQADGRFAGVVATPADEEADELVLRLADHARRIGAECAMTFYETDIVIASRVNELLGRPWAVPEADEISRDKVRQRQLCAKHGLPIPLSHSVSSVAEGMQVGERAGFPLIVKPSHLAASMGVTLVHDPAGLSEGLRAVETLKQRWQGSFYSGRETTLALVEEYLPGREVTVDGVVVSGRFHPAGVINKMEMHGPYFEEDYYTLPYRYPDEEPGIFEIVQGIVDALGVQHALFNAELRQDAQGNFRIIEFTTRMSGGQNYLNLRTAHGIDVVRLYAKAIIGPASDAFIGETPRLPGRLATCLKFAYRGGTVLRNTPGDAFASPHFRSYLPVAKPGDHLRRPPHGWYEIAGSLSVAGPYDGPQSIDDIERIARQLDTRLDILTVE